VTFYEPQFENTRPKLGFKIVT